MSDIKPVSPELTEELLSWLKNELAIVSSAHEAQWILEYIQTHHAQDQYQDAAQKIVSRRLRAEPLAYIFSSWAFREHEFYCGPGVLIPRPETEELVDHVVNNYSNRSSQYQPSDSTCIRIVDFGAGTGCLGISTALEFVRRAPSTQVDIIFVEQSHEAWHYLIQNIERHLVAQPNIKSSVFLGSWNDWPVVERDVVVSNPPYVTEAEFKNLEISVSEYEPKSALVPEHDPDANLVYEELLVLASRLGARCVAFELGSNQSQWLVRECAKFYPHLRGTIVDDMSGKPRFFIGSSAASRER